MAGEGSLITAVEDSQLVPAGSWTVWEPQVAERCPDLHDAINRFETLDNTAGHEAGRWLREEALRNDPSTKTYVLEHEGELQGFFACCGGTVNLTREDADGLDVVYRSNLPAFVLAWVARSRYSTLPGIHLMVTAYGLARDISRSMGLVAFALDPMDHDVAEMWQAEPYRFQLTRVDPDRASRRPPRLWLPLSF